MKILALIVLGAALLVGCGAFTESERAPRERPVAAVEDWTPLMQNTATGAGSWSLELHERQEPPPWPDWNEVISVEERYEMIVAHWAFMHGEELAREWAAQMLIELRIAEFLEINYGINEWGHHNLPPYVGSWLNFPYPNNMPTLQIVEGREDEAEDLLNFLSGLMEFNVELVQFSINELVDMSHHIWYTTINHTNENLRFIRFHVSSEENRIVVTLTDYNEDVIELFRQEIIDSPMVIFQEFLYG